MAEDGTKEERQTWMSITTLHSKRADADPNPSTRIDYGALRQDVKQRSIQLHQESIPLSEALRLLEESLVALVDACANFIDAGHGAVAMLGLLCLEAAAPRGVSAVTGHVSYQRFLLSSRLVWEGAFTQISDIPPPILAPVAELAVRWDPELGVEPFDLPSTTVKALEVARIKGSNLIQP